MTLWLLGFLLLECWSLEDLEVSEHSLFRWGNPYSPELYQHIYLTLWTLHGCKATCCVYISVFSLCVCCQLLKAWGANVTVTCSQNAEGLVRGLGADEVVDYTAGDAAEQLEMMEKYVFLSWNVCAFRSNQTLKLFSTLWVKWWHCGSEQNVLY